MMTNTNEDTASLIPTGIASRATSWMTCEACGNHQRGGSECMLCHWPEMSVDGPNGIQSQNIRVLIETEFRSNGSWHIGCMRTARLPELVDHSGLIPQLEDEGKRLLGINSSSSIICLPSMKAWAQFRDYAGDVLKEELNKTIHKNWPVPQKPSPLSVFVSIRIYLLNSELSSVIKIEPWLQIVPFQAAAAAAAEKISAKDIHVDCSQTRIGLASEGGNFIRATVKSPCELQVQSWRLSSYHPPNAPWPMLERKLTIMVKRDKWTDLPSMPLSADAVWGLAPDNNGVPQGEFSIKVLGKGEGITAELPACELPYNDQIAELMLDLGSTSTKWVVRVGSRIIDGDQATKDLVRLWGEESYPKADFIGDPTGALWAAWMARVLPALRRWVAEKHKAYLRNVFASLPSTKLFDVEKINDQMAGRVHPLRTQDTNQNSILEVTDEHGFSAIKNASREHLVNNGKVVLMPEHQLLANHYLRVLHILSDAARHYATKYHSHEERRNLQARMRTNWEAMDEAVRKYEKIFFLIRWIIDKPTDPSGPKPTIEQKIASPADWMFELIEPPDQFDHVVLLDAGGLSLDISVLDKHSLIPELSYSDSSCGGEEISGSIDKKERGPKGTRYKAQLGQQWWENRKFESTTKEQMEYRDVTRKRYEIPLKPLFEKLARLWNNCTVLLAGGGSMNPHLAEYVSELVGNLGIKVTVFNASDIQSLITEGRKFPEPLSELNSSVVKDFERTKGWSDRREQLSFIRYDKFALIGGMFAQLQESHDEHHSS